eukprot:756174-Hanusia_phi.AAC.2
MFFPCPSPSSALLLSTSRLDWTWARGSDMKCIERERSLEETRSEMRISGKGEKSAARGRQEIQGGADDKQAGQRQRTRLRSTEGRGRTLTTEKARSRGSRRESKKAGRKRVRRAEHVVARGDALVFLERSEGEQVEMDGSSSSRERECRRYRHKGFGHDINSRISPKFQASCMLQG